MFKPRIQQTVEKAVGKNQTLTKNQSNLSFIAKIIGAELTL